MSSGADSTTILWEWVEDAISNDERTRRRQVANEDIPPSPTDILELHNSGYNFSKVKNNKQHPLYEVYEDAVAQSASGKGQERHGHGLSFYEQKWTRLADVHGVGFLSGQAQKKLEEAFDAYRQGNCDMVWFEKELLGSLNYVAMAMLYLRRREQR